MARPKLTRPTDAEVEILRILWDAGAATARDVTDVLVAGGRETNASAVGTAIRTMIERGLVEVADERRPQRFKALISRDDTYKSLAADLKTRLFGGSLKSLVKHAFNGRRPTADEIRELKELIDPTE